ncbi:MAG TPA: extracellular solute-binding protein [Candidatus Angelobacter sp.]|nr:extracellular solute-binding protein [Candidatus Angelobacter sp.]
MKYTCRTLTRREFLISSGLLSFGVAAGFSAHVLAAGLSPLDVAYAGSMGSMMEGPVKAAAERSLNLEFRGRAQGASALAQLIVGGAIRPDVFVSVTPGPALTVLRAGKAEVAQPIAHTEMVIAYSPKSRFASRLEAAWHGKEDLWKVLLEPGLRFGRTDPVTDPQGRNIIFTVMLAQKTLNIPDLVEKLLGPTINEKQIFTEPTVMARLQSGELDAASAYKIQPGPFHLPYIALPADVNLSAQNVQAEHPDIALSVGGKTFHPEPLIYYASVLKDAPNPKGAAAFVEWLQGEDAQSILRSYQYDPPNNATALRA